MRITLAIGLALLTLGGIAEAQEQEQKMLDRVLKPNLTLQNSAQEKTFVVGGGIMARIAHTKPFFVSRQTWEKRYAGTKDFQAKQYATGESRFARQEANTSSRNKLTGVDRSYQTVAYETRSARDAGRAVATADYAGNRPFLLQGKSQKTLSAQDHSLTIDEVRELLNKNK